MPTPIRFTGFSFVPNRLSPAPPSTPASSTPAGNSDRLQLSPAAAAIQRELDAITAQLDRATQNRGRDDSGFTIQNPSDALTRFRVGRADLDPGDKFDLNVQVIQSAQRGSLYLSLGAPVLDFGGFVSTALGRIELNIAGAEGQQSFIFVSGTTMSDIADAVNAFADETGVRAFASSTGVVFRTATYGEDDFVSVTANSTSTNGPASQGEIFRFDPRDTNSVNAGTGTGYSNIPVTDFGQDIQALVNGQLTSGDGTRILYEGPRITTELDLSTGILGKGQTANAQNLGSFVALTVLYSNQQPGPLDTQA